MQCRSFCSSGQLMVASSSCRATHLFWRIAPECAWPAEDADEDWHQLLQERSVDLTAGVVIQTISQCRRGLDFQPRF